MFQKKQHQFQVWNVLYISLANATLAEFRKQRKLSYSSAMDKGHISLPLHCCSCQSLNHHATPWRSTCHVAHSSTHTYELKLISWLIHPDLMDSTSPSVLGCEGLCWVCAYRHKDRNNSQLSRAWLPQGCCCKMYFLENNDFQLNVPS
jgi:hypothetical protein